MLSTVPPDGVDVHHAHADVLLAHRTDVAHVDTVYLNHRGGVALAVRAEIGEALGQDVDIRDTQSIRIAAHVHVEGRGLVSETILCCRPFAESLPKVLESVRREAKPCSRGVATVGGEERGYGVESGYGVCPWNRAHAPSGLVSCHGDDCCGPMGMVADLGRHDAHDTAVPALTLSTPLDHKGWWLFAEFVEDLGDELALDLLTLPVECIEFLRLCACAARVALVEELDDGGGLSQPAGGVDARP